MLEPLAIGKWTLKAEVSDDTSTRRRSGRTGVSAPRGTIRMAQQPEAPRVVTTSRSYEIHQKAMDQDIGRASPSLRLVPRSVTDRDALLEMHRARRISVNDVQAQISLLQ